MMVLWNILNTIKGIIPGRHWIFYAALRLGSFMMIYFSLVGLAALLLSGSIFALIGLIPLFVFIGIRVSGGLTEQWRPKEDYRKK